MKTYKYPVFLSVILFSFVSTGYADVFGTDDKKWERVFSDLKKLSIRLTDNVDVQLKSVLTSQAETLRVIDGLKSALPALQGAIEQNDAKMTQQLSKLESRLAELEGKTKIQLDEQKKSQTEALNGLKQALAADMENFSKLNNASLAAINAGFSNIDGNNKKMIDILAKTLQEDQETGKSLGLVGKKVGEVNDHINLTRDMVTKLKDIISANQGAIHAQGEHNSKNIEKLLEVLQSLLTHDIAIATKIQQVEEKITQSMLKSDPINANLDLANQKLSKLIEILKAFATEQEKIVKNQQTLTDSLGNMRTKGDVPSQEPKKSSKPQKKSSQANEGKTKKSDD